MGNNKFFSNRVSSFMHAATRVSSRSLTKVAVAPHMALVVACRVIHTFAHNDELWDRYGQIPLEAARNALWLAFSIAKTPS